MIGIGFRVFSNKSIFYSIIEVNDGHYNYLSIDNINIPLALNTPDSLNHVRKNVIDIINEYNIDVAMVRAQEFSQSQNISTAYNERVYCEGVLLESLSGSTAEKYTIGRISQMDKLLDLKKGEFKEYADAIKPFALFPEKPSWADLTKEHREAILACHASFNL